MGPYALFPGCLVLQRMPHYERASYLVLRALGLDVQDLPGAACCGAPLAELSEDGGLLLAAYNLALAEKSGRKIVTICGACTYALRQAGRALSEDSVRQQINHRLGQIELAVRGDVQVDHLLQVLDQHREAVAKLIRRQLACRVALTHPCQAYAAWEGEDDPLHPRTMHRLVALTGAEIVEYEGQDECCGASLYLVDEALALESARRRLEAAQGADLMLDACGNCHFLLGRHQGTIHRQYSLPWLPALTFPQFLGAAMGMEAGKLGIGKRMWARVVQEGY